ncbi:TRAP transporter small permease [Breoghania sp.]|uniref:TRAP transporter small permease n=1 Tax=Breoghania sp. TaxID=2065378 RepID=UPI00261BEA43|nr:TRAP transporter small permease [Breoghania sp.]MDJ0932820.1 TRAP transporter small permease [Breoghania sp.]
MFALIEQVCLWLRRFAYDVVILLFVTMMVSVLVQVFGRYVANYSISQASEIATFCQIWLVLLGSGIAMSRSQHVAIDILPSQLPLQMRRVALVAIALVTACFLGVLAYGALPLLRIGQIQSSPALGVPMFWIYLCLPVGAAYIVLELFVKVMTHWANPFPDPSAAEPHEEGI